MRWWSLACFRTLSAQNRQGRNMDTGAQAHPLTHVLAHTFYYSDMPDLAAFVGVRISGSAAEILGSVGVGEGGIKGGKAGARAVQHFVAPRIERVPAALLSFKAGSWIRVGCAVHLRCARVFVFRDSRRGNAISFFFVNEFS